MKEKIEVSEAAGWYQFLHDVSTFRDVNLSGKVPSNHGRPLVVAARGCRLSNGFLFARLRESFVPVGFGQSIASFDLWLAVLYPGISNFRS